MMRQAVSKTKYPHTRECKAVAGETIKRHEETIRRLREALTHVRDYWPIGFSAAELLNDHFEVAAKALNESE